MQSETKAQLKSVDENFETLIVAEMIRSEGKGEGIEHI